MKINWCKFGIHRFHDGVLTNGNNVGTETTPIYFLESFRLCRKCGYKEYV